MYDAIIIGSGPAGISCALYLKRSNLNVLVIGNGKTNLSKAHKIDNYYGFPGGISGEDLYNNGIRQAEELGIEVKNEEVTKITWDETYTVETVDNNYTGKVMVLATGTNKVKPRIENLDEFTGKGVSYCAICDGFFYRNKTVTLIGNSNYVISECNDLINIASKVNIITNGKEVTDVLDKYLKEHNDISLYTDKVVKIDGSSALEKVVLESGEEVETDGLFIAEGSASATDIANTLGIITKGNFIDVNERFETNLEGAYAIGDAIGGLLQVSKAVADGALASQNIIKYLRESK
jgi:thioredoxin reductase (NADPH)